MKRFHLIVSMAVVSLLLALAPAQAKSSGGSHHSSSSSHASRLTGTRTRTTSSKSLPAGTHFVRKTCKTASCKAKHPSGSYMLPIKPKKTG